MKLMIAVLETQLALYIISSVRRQISVSSRTGCAMVTTIVVTIVMKIHCIVLSAHAHRIVSGWITLLIYITQRREHELCDFGSEVLREMFGIKVFDVCEQFTFSKT